MLWWITWGNRWALFFQLYCSLLFTFLEEGSDIVGPSRRLADHMQKLLEDAKGLSNRIDDPELKIQLMEGTRNLTRLTSKLLSDGQEMIGRRPNSQGNYFKINENWVTFNFSEISEMRSRQNNFNHTASNINNAIKNSGYIFFKLLIVSYLVSNLLERRDWIHWIPLQRKNWKMHHVSLRRLPNH